MGLIPKQRFDAQYVEIRENAASGGCTVLILVAADVDGICACKIVTSLLRADNVSYKVKPVSGYMDIKALEATIEDDDDLRSIVMLNCGAIVDVQAMLGLGSGDDDEEESPITCYILDSHRPIHLKNVYANDSEVQVLLGESTDASEYPSGGSDLSDEEDEEIDSDEDEDDMLDDGTVGGKRRRSGGQRRHQRTSERRRRILSYYERSYFGWPSSFMTYELAKQLNRDRNTQLWYAIVGMTAQYLEGHLDPTEYTTLAQQYSTLVDSKNSAAAKISVPLSAIDDDAAAAAAPGADAAGGGASLSLAASEDGRLTYDEDFRFKLHRHWSLYEAMFYSEYMAPRLGVWKNDGPDRLKQFLARLGVPLDDARQPFKMMKPQMKDRLKENVERHKAEFNLGDIFYGSFHRQCGYEAEADSAADVAYAMAALLECEGETPLVTESTVVESKDGEIDVLQTEEKRRLMRWENSVNRAFDSLNPRGRELYKEGITLSMSLQKSVVRLGTGLIEKKVIQNSGPFRYAMLDTLSDSDATLFTQPLSLAKLARFITEARRETGSQRWTGKRAKPLILCALNALRGTYMVVGVTCNARYLDVRRSAIGTAFKEATKEIRDCRYRKDNFDSSVIEVHKDDVLPFIHALYDHVRP